MERPGFYNLLDDISAFADIYILTASSKSRANNVRRGLSNKINSLIKDWFSSYRGNIDLEELKIRGLPLRMHPLNREYLIMFNRAIYPFINTHSLMIGLISLNISDRKAHIVVSTV